MERKNAQVQWTPTSFQLRLLDQLRSVKLHILEWVAFPSPGDLPNPGIKPRSPTPQAHSLRSELPVGVGSLSLLQGVFLKRRDQIGVSCIAGRFKKDLCST